MSAHATQLVESPPSLARRIRSAISIHGRLSWWLALRALRLALVKSGLALSRPFLVLQCNAGRDAAGLFSEFSAVLGLIEHYERWHAIYAGAGVDFKDRGLYFDPEIGPNWWEYYFEPVVLGQRDGAPTQVVRVLQHDKLAERVEERLTRERRTQLINRYIRVKPAVRERVEHYVRGNFGDDFVVGVHYRGTDKHAESPRVSYEAVHKRVLETLARYSPKRFRLFVATDEHAFLEWIARRFPGQVMSLDAIRSLDGAPVHETSRENYRKGEDAVVDCLLLSRCDCLVRTVSNLSMCSTLFNPELPETLVTCES